MENLKEFMEELEAKLPKIQMQVLQKQLGRLDDLESKNANQVKQIDHLNLLISDYEKKDHLYKSLNEREANLMQKAEELRVKEQGLEVKMLQKELDLTKESRQQIFMLVDTLVRNPKAIEIINGNAPVALHAGGYVGTGPYTQTKETIEQKH